MHIPKDVVQLEMRHVGRKDLQCTDDKDEGFPVVQPDYGPTEGHIPNLRGPLM